MSYTHISREAVMRTSCASTNTMSVHFIHKKTKKPKHHRQRPMDWDHMHVSNILHAHHPHKRALNAFMQESYTPKQPYINVRCHIYTSYVSLAENRLFYRPVILSDAMYIHLTHVSHRYGEYSTRTLSTKEPYRCRQKRDTHTHIHFQCHQFSMHLNPCIHDTDTSKILDVHHPWKSPIYIGKRALHTKKQKNSLT